MNSQNMQQDDIHIIGRNSNLTKEDVSKALKKHVYNNKKSWQKFFRLFLISLGVGFTVSGIVFFFAYNWEDLHKFVKIGLVEGILIVTTALVLLPKTNSNTKNIILTGSSILVGILFAVFGQIYQTGANAYDFFLAWTLFITLWVIISNFSPLWLLYLVLINTTVILYFQQVAKNWSLVLILTLLFIINLTVPTSTILFVKKNIPHWFTKTVTLASVCYATLGIVVGIMGQYQPVFPILFFLTATAFFFGIRHGLRTKSGFYLSIISFSVIIIASSLLIKIFDSEFTFLIISFFIISSITFTIKKLINIQKKWANEE